MFELLALELAEFYPDIRPYGEAAFLLDFRRPDYDEGLSRFIHSLNRSFQSQGFYDEIVPGYDSLLLSFNPLMISPDTILTHIKDALGKTGEDTAASHRVEIPVCYGGEYGPDMENIQKSSGLSAEDIISRHSGRDYHVCMMGFIPGFSFLSALDPVLAHPRHVSPRGIVPAGSVGIANWQTGIYGLESPGGWQIIGRTPVQIFDGAREAPFLLSPGDKVRFVPSGPDIFERKNAPNISGKIRGGHD